MVNETTICHKCGYEGFHRFFWRTDENGEFITTDRKSAKIKMTKDMESYLRSEFREIRRKNEARLKDDLKTPAKVVRAFSG